jgi:hypothetical protein
MFKRYGVFVLAFGLILSAQVFAQSPDQAVDQQEEGDRQEQSQDSPAPLGFPVWILEDPEQAERSELQQGEAAQREIDDLVAQQNAAKAAEGAFKVGVAQTILAFFGTLALVYSLMLNRQATTAAVDAVTTSRKIGQAQTRAYVGLESTSLSVSESRIYGKVTFQNFGQSTANEAKFRLMWSCQAGEFVQDWLTEAPMSRAVGSMPPTGQVVRTFATNESLDTEKSLSKTQIADLMAGRSTFWVFGDMTYIDAFDRAQKTSFRLWMANVDGKYALAFCDEGNEST